MANIITPTRNTESFTPINDGRRMPVFIKRLVTYVRLCGDLDRPHMLILSFRVLNDQQNQ